MPVHAEHTDQLIVADFAQDKIDIDNNFSYIYYFNFIFFINRYLKIGIKGADSTESALFYVKINGR